MPARTRPGVAATAATPVAVVLAVVALVAPVAVAPPATAGARSGATAASPAARGPTSAAVGPRPGPGAVGPGAGSVTAAGRATSYAAARTPPPSALVPAPSRARADEPVVYHDGCHAGKASTAVQSRCVVGARSGRVRVLVFGDSHVAQWYGALRRAAEAEGWRMTWLTKTACPAADVSVRKWRVFARYPECDAWRRHVLAWVRAQPRFDLVVAGGYAGHELVSRPGGAPLTGAARTSAWQAGVARTARVLATSADRVLWLRDTPRMRVDVPRCLLAHPTVHACATPRAPAFAVGFWRAEQAAVAGLPGVAAVDWGQGLCGPAWCEPNAGRVLRWRDDGHFTDTFSRTLGAEVRARLRAALGPSAGGTARSGGPVGEIPAPHTLWRSCARFEGVCTPVSTR